MHLDKFIPIFQDLLQRDEPVFATDTLADMEEWDSLAIMALIAWFDKNCAAVHKHFIQPPGSAGGINDILEKFLVFFKYAAIRQSSPAAGNNDVLVSGTIGAQSKGQGEPLLPCEQAGAAAVAENGGNDAVGYRTRYIGCIAGQQQNLGAGSGGNQPCGHP